MCVHAYSCGVNCTAVLIQISGGSLKKLVPDRGEKTVMKPVKLECCY